MRISQNLLRVYNMLMRTPFHQVGIRVIIFRRNISRMERNYSWCNFAHSRNYCFFQNNISRKLLFILARMINSLGLCLKNVSKLIDAFVTSSIYFDVQKFPYLFENIYISNLLWKVDHLSRNLTSKIFSSKVGLDLGISLKWIACGF